MVIWQRAMWQAHLFSAQSDVQTRALGEGIGVGGEWDWWGGGGLKVKNVKCAIKDSEIMLWKMSQNI